MSDTHDTTKADLRSLQDNAFKIQMMLRMALEGRDSLVILDKLTPAISYHFDSVESLNINIPQ